MAYPDGMNWAEYNRRYGVGPLEYCDPNWHLSDEGRALVGAYCAAMLGGDDDAAGRAFDELEEFRVYWAMQGQPDTDDGEAIDCWLDMIPFVEDVCEAALKDAEALRADVTRWAA